MSSNALVFSWRRPIPSREHHSQQHFGDFIQYLEGLKGSQGIEDYQIVFLNPRGDGIHGMFLLQGSSSALDTLVNSDEWIRHMIRAQYHLEQVSVDRGVTGEAVMGRFQMWSEQLQQG